MSIEQLIASGRALGDPHEGTISGALARREIATNAAPIIMELLALAQVTCAESKSYILTPAIKAAVRALREKLQSNG